jgi:hypothetical protein
MCPREKAEYATGKARVMAPVEISEILAVGVFPEPIHCPNWPAAAQLLRKSTEEVKHYARFHWPPGKAAISFFPVVRWRACFVSTVPGTGTGP